MMVAAVLLGARATAAQSPVTAIRINQLGYLPDAPKTAVVCSLQDSAYTSFTVIDMQGHRLFGPQNETVHSGHACRPSVSTSPHCARPVII